MIHKMFCLQTDRVVNDLLSTIFVRRLSGSV